MSTDKFFCVSTNEKYNDIQNDGKNVQRINIIRREHPNCAIYKKTVSTLDEELIRTTLYTPNKRISQDISKEGNQTRSCYVSTESHLETLLIYLKDIEVRLNDIDIIAAAQKNEDSILVGELCQTPYRQMLTNWTDAESFEKLKDTKTFASCIYQMKKILRAQLECAQEAVQKYNIMYFTFGDILTPMEQGAFEKYYYKYYRQASKEYEGLNMLIKIGSPLTDFNNILDRKHIKGVVLTNSGMEQQ
ncbi:MAG: hypothetical protein AB1Z23_11335 [Eubacteriales bacterium]